MTKPTLLDSLREVASKKMHMRASEEQALGAQFSLLADALESKGVVTVSDVFSLVPAPTAAYPSGSGGSGSR